MDNKTSQISYGQLWMKKTIYFFNISLKYFKKDKSYK